MRYLLMTLVIAASLGCAQNTVAPRSEAAGPTGSSASARAPMTAEWIFQSEGSGRLTLIARVNRFAAIRVPVTVSVSAPAGVRVISGRPSWIIPASETITPVEETYVFEVLQSGQQEIVLAADAEGVGFGVHAKKAYKLGGSTQKVEASTAPSGPTLEVGGRDFGPAVPGK